MYQYQSSDEYSITFSVCKPNANFHYLTRGMGSYISYFNSDYVVLLVVSMFCKVTKYKIIFLANKCFFTNLIVCTTPVTARTSQMNDMFNKMIQIYATSSVKYFIKNSIYLHKLGLHNSAENIQKVVVNFLNSRSSSLICVNKNTDSDLDLF